MAERFMGRDVTRNSPAEYAKTIAEEAISPVKKLGEAMAPYADKGLEVGKRLFGGTDKSKDAERERNYQEELKRRGIKPSKGR